MFSGARRRSLLASFLGETSTPTAFADSSTASPWQNAGAEDKKKAQFLVAIHVLYFLGTLPSLAVHHLFVASELDGRGESAAVFVRCVSLTFYPCNLLVYHMTGHLRLAVFMFLLYSQAVVLWLSQEGDTHSIEYLCLILFAVASVHVVGKRLGMFLLFVITLEAALLESRPTGGIGCSTPPNPTSLHASVLRLSIVLCTCLTSLLHEYLHGDAAIRLQKCMDQRMKFFALISHDLRAPLQSIQYVAADLLRTELPQEVRTVVDVVQESSNHLLCLLNNLLELSRVELGALDLREQRFNLAYLVDRLLRPAKVTAERNSIELRANVSISQPIRHGDPVRLRQVIDNLLSNAFKFTRAGGFVEVNIAEVRNQPDKIRVEVIDSGIGIDSEVASTLFKSFTQVDSELEKSHGFGLGLAICKKICQAMDGQIAVESKRSKGSKFWFEVRLPVTESAAVDEDEIGSSGDEHPCRQAGDAEESTLQGKRILLVEDSRLIQMTMKRMLNNLGCIVETAWNGTEALELLEEKHREQARETGSSGDDSEDDAGGSRSAQQGGSLGLPFDAVLCDIHMPGLDGYHTAQAIRAWERGVSEAEADDENERNESGELALQERERGEEAPYGGTASSTGDERPRAPGSAMPIIGISASMLNGEARKCFESGMNDFLLKPPRREQLHRCLERWIGGGSDGTGRASTKARRPRRRGSLQDTIPQPQQVI